MIPIEPPAGPQTARPWCRLVQMRPPRGVSDDDCGTAPMLIQFRGDPLLPGFPDGKAQYAYFKPTDAELAQLQDGGFIEFCQIGTVVQPFSAVIWPATADSVDDRVEPAP